MAFVNKVCDKVFVINLDKEKERLQNFDSYMKKNSIKYDRFNAILGSKILKDERLSDFCNTFCTDGMKGCALSHRSIWELMIEKDYKNVLIFEDDAVVDENFDRDFHFVWDALPKDYDIVYFGCLFGCKDNSVSNSIYKKIAGINSEDVNEYIQTTKGSMGLHAYMLSLEGAKKFVNKQINTHVDTQILLWVKQYNYVAYNTNPNMVETSQDSSSISDTYPYLLNSGLRHFTLNNLKRPSTVDWAFSENLFKLGGFNFNYLLIMLILFVSLLPKKYFIYVYLWLLIEFFISLDYKNTLRFFIILSIPMILKYVLTSK
jgi:GR25 family glycosyltransferase involved in LPS biosynthesis